MENVAKVSSGRGALTGDIFGGVAAMLVALPSAIAFGLIIYAPLGPAFSSQAAIGGIIGTVIMGLAAATVGRTHRLISAPCAPAAAVLSLFVGEMVSRGSIPPEMVPVYIALVVLGAGAIQLAAGRLGGGTLIKYIPYPVVAGYLSGVGVLIFIGQLPKFIGLAKGTTLGHGLFSPELWQWQSLTVGVVTITAMLVAPRIVKAIPAAIIALAAGIGTYLILAALGPLLRTLDHNPFVIGAISASAPDLARSVAGQWSRLAQLDISVIAGLAVPVLTLAVLLSVDTLKTCVVLDALTNSRHNSNRELMGQGLGNLGCALLGGVPGAGTMGATLVNVTSGGQTNRSGQWMGLSALMVLLLLGRFVAWIPIAALAGILLVVAVRMVDRKSVFLLKHHSTRFDFFVILAVVVAAVTLSLIAAAGVGIALAIILFVRQQIRTPVVRRLTHGGQVFSKKVRTQAEQDVLEKRGKEILIAELQGQLFFGTTDQLITELEPHLPQCRCAVLDMRRVQSLDYTAANRLKQVLARLADHNGCLIFSSVPQSLPSGQNVKRYLGHLGLGEAECLKFFPTLDAALEWAEDRILTESQVQAPAAPQRLDINGLELFSGFPAEAVQTIGSCLREQSYAPGEFVFRAGAPGEEMYLIRQGTVKIMLPLGAGAEHHLATFANGAFFGDLSFLDKGVRSADAVAVDAVELYILSRSAFDRVTASHPEAARLFFERLSHVISHRLRQSNIEIKALGEN
jgi:SulP family sulfate permease